MRSHQRWIVVVLWVAIVLTGCGSTATVQKSTPTPTRIPFQFPTATPILLIPTLAPINYYNTQVPGPTFGLNCDAHGALWTVQGSTTYQCFVNTNTIISQSAQRYIGKMAFTFAGSLFSPFKFPQTYAVRAEITPADGSCGGLEVLASSNNSGGIVGYVCSNDYWDMYQYDIAGNVTPLMDGYLSSSTSVHQVGMQVTSTEVTFIIDGQSRNSASRTSSDTPSNEICLTTQHIGGTGTSSATFTNFTYAAA